MLLLAAAVLIVAAGAAMVDYLSKYGSCGELTAVDNVDIAIKSNKLSATRALSAEQIPGFAGTTT